MRLAHPHLLALVVAAAAATPATSAATDEAVTVDVTAPSVRITSPDEGAVTGRAVRITYAADEPGVTFRCRVDLGRTRPCGDGAHDEPNLPPGVHRFRVGATDAAGNAGPMTLRTFRVGADPAESEDGVFHDWTATPDLAVGAVPPVPSSSFTTRHRVSSGELRRRGFRVAVAPAAGTGFVRVGVVRISRGVRPVATTVRAVRGTARHVIVLRDRAVRRVRPGRYRIELASGPSRTGLGAATHQDVVVSRTSGAGASARP